MAVYQRGETVGLRVETRDPGTDALTNVTSVEVTLTDPNGLPVWEEEPVVLDSTGIYKLPTLTDPETPPTDYDGIFPAGWYTARYTVTDGDNIIKVDDGFELTD